MGDGVALGGLHKSEPEAVATGSFSRRSTKSVTANPGLNGKERLSLRTDLVATASGSDFVSPGSKFILTHSSFDTSVFS